LTAYSNIFTEAARKAMAGLKEEEEYEANQLTIQPGSEEDVYN